MSQIDDLANKVSELDKRISALENQGVPQVSSSNANKKISPKEYILLKKPVGGTETTFYLGAHLEMVERVSPFTAEDIRSQYGKSKLTLPSNTNDTINKNVAKGLFKDAPPKNKMKAWELTLSGEELANREK